MRRNTNETAPATKPATSRWIPRAELPEVGLDPAVWTRRVRQIALWRLVESWNSGQRLH